MAGALPVTCVSAVLARDVCVVRCPRDSKANYRPRGSPRPGGSMFRVCVPQFCVSSVVVLSWEVLITRAPLHSQEKEGGVG